MSTKPHAKSSDERAVLHHFKTATDYNQAIRKTDSCPDKIYAPSERLTRELNASINPSSPQKSKAKTQKPK